MDALAPTAHATQAAPPAPAPQPEAAVAAHAAPTPAPAAPLPPLPAAVQRTQLESPAPKLMTREQMAALLSLTT
jgi:hypothetical protein